MMTRRLVVPPIGLALAAAPAEAQQVGTATAGNPLSESTPPGGGTAPLVVGPTFDQAHPFADAVAPRLAATNPDRLTTEFLKQKREGRLFVDVNRNAYAQTAVAPYAVRARRGAPIALPIEWTDAANESLTPDGFTIRNVWDLLADRGDPWAGMEAARRPLPDLTESEKPNRSGRRKGAPRQGGS